MSLADFAKENPSHRGSPCWLCQIPEVEEINAAKREGTATVNQMMAYLVKKQGYDAAEVRIGRFNHHFQAKHHLA